MNKIKGLICNYRFILLITGIIYIILSLLSKKYIEGNVINSIRVFACFSFVKGIIEIFNFNYLKSRIIKGYGLVIMIGAFEIITGVGLNIFVNLNENILRFVFGLWILLDASVNFLTLDVAKKIHIYYFWLCKVIYIIGIIIGIVIIFDISHINLNVLLSNYFIMFGVIKILGSALNKNYIYSVK